VMPADLREKVSLAVDTFPSRTRVARNHRRHRLPPRRYAGTPQSHGQVRESAPVCSIEDRRRAPRPPSPRSYGR
jgi:hypothetical protein